MFKRVELYQYGTSFGRVCEEDLLKYIKLKV